FESSHGKNGATARDVKRSPPQATPSATAHSRWRPGVLAGGEFQGCKAAGPWLPKLSETDRLRGALDCADPPRFPTRGERRWSVRKGRGANSWRQSAAPPAWLRERWRLSNRRGAIRPTTP